MVVRWSWQVRPSAVASDEMTVVAHPRTFTLLGLVGCSGLDLRVAVERGRGNRLDGVSVLDDFAGGVEAERVDDDRPGVAGPVFTEPSTTTRSLWVIVRTSGRAAGSAPARGSP